jgi:membrane-bound lytic murein transglycosylase D
MGRGAAVAPRQQPTVPPPVAGPAAGAAATPALAPVAVGAEAAARRAPLSDSARRDVSPTEIVAEVSKVFGGPPPAAQSVDSAATGPVWDIDVRSYETHDRVEHFVGIFSGRAKDDFAASLKRQTRYGAMIRQRLKAGGLPEDMIFLALVESWYDPHAYSSAAAVGMWQFMTRTARGSGMRVDWWIDERRDPVRSTEGAVRYLAGLKDQFGGSLYLAAAAYNGGDGRVSRGLALYADDMKGVEGEDRFFSLSDTKYLRPQTRDYVPKLIAAALVGKEPERYGITVDSLPPFAYDSITVPPLTSVAAIAAAAGTTVAEMKDLNPHILRGTTPPGDPFLVRVPSGASWLSEKFAELPAAERLAVKHVESKKGESMASIAKKAGISARQLAWYNPKVAKLKSGNLRAGQTILVPTRGTVSAAFDVPDPAIERFPKRPAPTPKGKSAASKKPSAKTGVSKSAAKKPVSKPSGKASGKAAPKSSGKASATGATSSNKPGAKKP